jgi:eukaryotic-like serine/threonine-protein kinase
VRVGEVIDGRYRIDVHADEGGMGTVYKGVDLVTAQPVAVKVLRGDEEVERFQREAVVLAELTHPGIVQYRASGQVKTGEHYLVMEWVDGETLARRIAVRGVNTHEALAIAKRIAEALDTMHWRGVVHRDLKPKNLILVEGRPDLVKILDFGIARHSQEITSLTRTGTMVGSLSYMAPEQARGTREIDGRLDLFGLGCVLYECLTGRVPFSGGDPVAIRAKILLVDPPPIQVLNTDISEDLASLVNRLLEKDPERRPGTAGHVAMALGKLVERPGTRHPRGRPRTETAETRSLGSPSPSPKEPSSIVCMVLVGTAEDELSWEAMEELQADRRSKMSREVPEGGQVEVMDDGWSIVTLRGAGSTQDLVARAARLALKLRGEFPNAPMVIAAQRAPGDALDEVIDRGAETIVRESLESVLADAAKHPGSGAIRLDDVTIRLLPEQFHVVRSPSGYFLTGERH